MPVVRVGLSFLVPLIVATAATLILAANQMMREPDVVHEWGPPMEDATTRREIAQIRRRLALPWADEQRARDRARLQELVARRRQFEGRSRVEIHFCRASH